MPIKNNSKELTGNFSHRLLHVHDIREMTPTAQTYDGRGVIPFVLRCTILGCHSTVPFIAVTIGDDDRIRTPAPTNTICGTWRPVVFLRLFFVFFDLGFPADTRHLEQQLSHERDG